MPKGYIRPNYVSPQEEQRAAQQRAEEEATLQRMRAEQATRRRERRILLGASLLLIALWLPLHWVGYPGCGLIVGPVGIAMLLIWALEVGLVKSLKNE